MSERSNERQVAMEPTIAHNTNVRAPPLRRADRTGPTGRKTTGVATVVSTDKICILRFPCCESHALIRFQKRRRAAPALTPALRFIS